MKKIIVAFMLSVFSVMAWAWPTRDITIIVPFAPGGFGDNHARATAVDLERILGQKVVVRNMPGGAMAVAMNSILIGDNDHHTFMWSMDDLLVTPIVQGTGQHERFVVTNVVGTYTGLLFGGPGASVERLRQQIVQGATVNVGNIGHNGNYHLWTTNTASTLKMNPVPYKGSAPMIADVLGGHTEYGISQLSNVQGLIQEGRLVPVMTTSATRHPNYPNVPTFRELGLRGDPLQGWMGFAARADTNPAALRAFSSAVRTSSQSNTFTQGIAQRGVDLVNLGQDESARFVAQDLIRIRKYKF